jgi:protein-S-isoprenylcysteine O-methyltransferase Ste14
VPGDKPFRPRRHREVAGTPYPLDLARIHERLSRSQAAKPANRLKSRIRHLIYLTLWAAMILAACGPLIGSLPHFVKLVVNVSGVAAVAIIVLLYAVALLMEERDLKQRIVNLLCYLLIGDGILFFILSVASHQVWNG